MLEIFHELVQQRIIDRAAGKIRHPQLRGFLVDPYPRRNGEQNAEGEGELRPQCNAADGEKRHGQADRRQRPCEIGGILLDAPCQVEKIVARVAFHNDAFLHQGDLPILDGRIGQLHRFFRKEPVVGKADELFLPDLLLRLQHRADQAEHGHKPNGQRRIERQYPDALPGAQCIDQPRREIDGHIGRDRRDDADENSGKEIPAAHGIQRPDAPAADVQMFLQGHCCAPPL